MKRATFLWLSALAAVAASYRSGAHSRAVGLKRPALHSIPVDVEFIRPLAMAGRCVCVREPLRWAGYALADMI